MRSLLRVITPAFRSKGRGGKSEHHVARSNAPRMTLNVSRMRYSRRIREIYSRWIRASIVEVAANGRRDRESATETIPPIVTMETLKVSSVKEARVKRVEVKAHSVPRQRGAVENSYPVQPPTTFMFYVYVLRSARDGLLYIGRHMISGSVLQSITQQRLQQRSTAYRFSSFTTKRIARGEMPTGAKND